MTNPLDAINSLVQNATAQSQLRWLVCRACGDVREHDMSTIPAATPCHCGHKFDRITLAPKALAEQKAEEIRLNYRPAAATSEPAPVAPTAEAPAAEAPAAEAPATESRRGRKAKGEKAEAKPEPQTHSAPVLAPEPVLDVLPADLMQAPTPAQMTNEEWSAKRDADKALFIKAHGVGIGTWTPVGSGRLFTTGFWSEREDGTRFVDWFELHDTPQSFASRYNEARLRDPRTAADQGLINDLTGDLGLVAFRGTVTASLRECLQKCSVRPSYGCRVQLSAKLTEHGNIAFQVTAVSK